MQCGGGDSQPLDWPVQRKDTALALPGLETAERGQQINELAVGLFLRQRRVCAALPTTAGGESGDDLHIKKYLV